MHKKLSIFSLLILMMIPSCGGSSLRSDILDFISPLSYQVARNAVNKGYYKDESNGKYQGKDCYFLDEVDFSILVDSKEVTYSHHYKSINYGLIADQEYFESITTVEGIYIYDNRGEISEISYDKAYEVTSRFFYSEYYPESNHHYGAMYYGDILKSEAYKQQQFVTISEDKSIYQYKVDGFKENGVVISMDYQVNNIGMLISLKDEGYSETDPTTYFKETIITEY